MVKKATRQNRSMDIPDYQIEALARCLLPKIRQYYESEEGKKDLKQYRAEKAKQAQAGKDREKHGKDQNGKNREHSGGNQTA